MKAALRVLTAISERQEPAQADVDELHWYAPSDRDRPLDELVCDAIQRAMRDREEKRKIIKEQARARAIALRSSAERNERDFETEHRARARAERRQELNDLTDKLKRLGIALQQAAGNLTAAGAGDSAANSDAARNILESAGAEVDLSSITELLDEHARLTRELVEEE
jgi:hypothetical protein